MIAVEFKIAIAATKLVNSNVGAAEFVNMLHTRRKDNRLGICYVYIPSR